MEIGEDLTVKLEPVRIVVLVMMTMVRETVTAKYAFRLPRLLHPPLLLRGRGLCKREAFLSRDVS